ncbi:MAG: hypothetical protein ACRBB0_22455 [Pelagimonas sp.]|uniref:hypothetical protein n=1 Tax=Pelagimonas sp. TaxID=2073170 RepID=UPI003D6B1DA6
MRAIRSQPDFGAGQSGGQKHVTDGDAQSLELMTDASLGMPFSQDQSEPVKRMSPAAMRLDTIGRM